MPAPPSRYAIYARKSDDDRRATEKSIGDQLREARALAAHHGLSVVAEYEESRSARVPGRRPLWAELVKKVRAGEVDGIVCWHVNRLARNMQEGGELAQLLIDGRLAEVRTPHATYRSGDNILPIVLETGTSAQYSIETIRNVERGMRSAFEAGGITTRAPIGYKNGRDPENPKRGTVNVDPEPLALIRKAFELLLTGAYTVAQLRRVLNDELGLRGRGGRPLSLPQAYKLFANPFYAGMVRYKGELRPGRHPAILTPEEFRQAQAALEAQRRPRARERKHAGEGLRRFAFTGLLRCGHCGQQVTAEFHRVGVAKRPYEFYRCADSWRRCTKRGMNSADLEDAILVELSRVRIADPGLLEVARRAMLTGLEEKRAQLEAVRSQREAALKEAEKRQWRLEDMYARGLIESEERYRAHMAEAREEKERLAEAAGMAAGGELDAAVASAEAALAFLGSAREAFLSGDAYKKREVAAALATGYRFFGPEKRVEVDIHPALLAVLGFAREVERAQEQSRFRSGYGSSRPTGRRRARTTAAVGAVQTTPSASSAPFEPAAIGSGSTKESPRSRGLSPGGSEESLFDAPSLFDVPIPALPPGEAIPRHCPLASEAHGEALAAYCQEEYGVEISVEDAREAIWPLMRLVWAANLPDSSRLSG